MPKSYLPSTEELDLITNLQVPVNTKKSIEKWVNVLKNWYKKVGYDHKIKTITNKSQLEWEMQEFIVGVRQLKSGEYSPSFLKNELILLSQWIYDVQSGPTKFKLSQKDNFRNL
ncbi:42543_t:CDS:2 [Gigaspora margarita]|uniref:42543_t:CDS:1 n=1 Tax=Gigaspora margarita TaxID=4874 RepID=A0ABN7WXY8_GIGMA|nr:42543_t:CDS:2 [Gigaspora margarita]